MNSQPKFKVGDVVRMRCTYVPLIIGKYRSTLSDPKRYYYKCAYFDDQGIIQEKELAETLLRKF